MWDRAGTAYVYLVYGMYHCLNVVTEPAGRPAALLIRAVEPIEGADRMRAGRIEALARRRRLGGAALEAERGRIEALPASRLARGPGLVGAAYQLDRGYTGLDLLDPTAPVRLEAPGASDRAPRPAWTPRIGIDYAGAPWTGRPWRLIDASSASVSGPRPRGARGSSSPRASGSAPGRSGAPRPRS